MTCIRSSSGVPEKGALVTAQPSASPTATLDKPRNCQLTLSRLSTVEPLLQHVPRLSALTIGRHDGGICL